MLLAVDTNVLIRALVDDGTEQTRRAKESFATHRVFIPTSVLLETEWVLRSHVRLDRHAVNALLVLVARAQHVEIEGREQVLHAIDAHERGFDFADAIHLFSASRCDALCTFDTDFRRKAKTLDAAIPVITP